jgi:hypothetical protein
MAGQEAAVSGGSARLALFPVMKMQQLIQLGILFLGSFGAAAQTAELAPPAGQPVVPSIPRPAEISVLLSNKAVAVISQARGIPAAAVKLKFSDAVSARFEIDLAGVRDLRREAELLSRSLGTNVAVILDEVTSDGRMRTNHVFRAGSAQRTVAPVSNKSLRPGGRRLYVWPETSKVSAPSNIRLVQQAN